MNVTLTTSDKLNAKIASLTTSQLLDCMALMDNKSRQAPEGALVFRRMATEAEARIPKLYDAIGESIDADETYEITYAQHMAGARSLLGI